MQAQEVELTGDPGCSALAVSVCDLAILYRLQCGRILTIKTRKSAT